MQNSPTPPSVENANGGIATYVTDLTRETDVGMRRHIAPDGGGQLGLVVTPPQLLHLHPTPAILPPTFSALQHTMLKTKKLIHI
jgi:hypothetical protein